MSKDSHKIVATWEKIAEYFPGFSENQVRKRFGKEMKMLGVVHKGGAPGRKNRCPVIWGIVWSIERYWGLKAMQRGLGVYKRSEQGGTDER